MCSYTNLQLTQGLLLIAAHEFAHESVVLLVALLLQTPQLLIGRNLSFDGNKPRSDLGVVFRTGQASLKNVEIVYKMR